MSACVTEEIKHAKELNVNVSNGKKRPVEVERETHVFVYSRLLSIKYLLIPLMNIQWTSVFYFFMLCRVSLSIFKARPVKTLFSRSRLMMISSESRSAVVNHSFGATSIVVVPMFDDNYGYIFVDEFSRSCAVIDPADTEPMIKALNDLESERGVVLKQVWCTHKHAGTL